MVTNGLVSFLSHCNYLRFHPLLQMTINWGNSELVSGLHRVWMGISSWVKVDFKSNFKAGNWTHLKYVEAVSPLIQEVGSIRFGKWPFVKVTSLSYEACGSNVAHMFPGIQRQFDWIFVVKGSCDHTSKIFSWQWTRGWRRTTAEP